MPIIFIQEADKVWLQEEGFKHNMAGSEYLHHVISFVRIEKLNQEGREHGKNKLECE